MKKMDKQKKSRMILRLLKDTPKFVGPDMFEYGPYEKEDVAVLPIEIAKILLKSNKAEEIKSEETSKKAIVDATKIKDNVRCFIEDIFPEVIGYDTLKESLFVSMISPEPINIFLVGDPCSGKSKILKSIQKATQNSSYISGNIYGKITSTKEIAINEISRKSDILLVDNLSKIPTEEQPIITELMDQGITVIAAANPSFGRFDPYETISRQIDLPPTTINKFDLIFPIKDLPDVQHDEKMVDFFFSEKPKDISFDDFNKFKRECKSRKVELSKEAKDTIKEYYIKIRKAGLDENNYSCIRTVPLSLKQVDTLAKLSKAYASISQRSIASDKDAQRAIRILEYFLCQLGFDKHTGLIDIDRIETGISARARHQISLIKDIILELEGNIGKTIPIEDIFEEASKNHLDPEEVEEILEKLKRAGDIYEVRQGFISRI
jgi:replicative DNA helicase Mcm